MSCPQSEAILCDQGIALYEEGVSVLIPSAEFCAAVGAFHMRGRHYESPFQFGTQ